MTSPSARLVVSLYLFACAMSPVVELRKPSVGGSPLAGHEPVNAVCCPVLQTIAEPSTLTSELCHVLKSAGCPLAPRVKDYIGFESLLAELSATFISLPASRIDSHIDSSLQRLVEHLGLDRGGLAELLPDQKQIVITHSFQLPQIPPIPQMILDDQLPWYTSTIRRGEVLRLTAIPADLPLEARQEREFCVRQGMKSHVMIPLIVRGSVTGAIGFSSFQASYSWPDDLIQRLRLVGEIFTNAVSRKRSDAALLARELSLRQSRRILRKLAAKLLKAQEEERRRIAREMHDDWTQRLAVLGISLANVEAQIESPAKALVLIRQIQAQLVSLSEDVHDLSRQLHPSILDDLGLIEALRSECASFSRRERITVKYLPETVPPGLALDVALGVYRVAQEALRNLAKHASVAEAQVSLGILGSDLLLRVRDEGIGFDLDEERSEPGIGLSSMRERVRLIRGKLSITSSPGLGTTVEVRVPLARSDS